MMPKASNIALEGETAACLSSGPTTTALTPVIELAQDFATDDLLLNCICGVNTVLLILSVAMGCKWG
jgi:hypothetical protein